ncbi:MAG: tRNA glutamyl-Q(34) synthetase GluQRS [Gammaproteobacteria bacterium]|nr:tRNA glutamyl-Q(34) synthetase GluQRS [Gammaproteobacteria bacterium]
MVALQKTQLKTNSGYVGRFAPTPSGPLHFGSLVAALASYLDARAQRGQWLVRIEDIDPPRCQTGASDHILRTLEQFGLHWDGDICYQSQQDQHYRDALEQLQQQGLLYYCTCSRSQLQGQTVYPGHCRDHPKAAHQAGAWRIKAPAEELGFNDLIMPPYKENLAHQVGDFILRRKDGLFAYQLAVVVDDARQGITHVIRGADLYQQTPRQVFLQGCLGLPTLTYGHIPLIVNQAGQKLSKQNLATAITSGQAPQLISQALQRLGQNLPSSLIAAPVTEQLDWAIMAWQRQDIPSFYKDPHPFLDSPLP